MVDQGLACFLELVEPLFPRVDRVVFPLCQSLAGDIVLAGNFGCIEVGVVDPAGGLVNPARGDPGENNRRRRDKMDDKVHGDEGIQCGGLGSGAGKAVQNE